MSAPPAVATPNSVLNEEAFKILRDLSSLDSGDEEEDVGKEAVGERSSDDKNNLAITNLGLLQPLVDSLFKCGITHLFLIQATWGRCLAKDQVALTVGSGMDMPIIHDIDRYKLVRDIGSGNFGIVRMMWDKQSKELVAVKYIEHGEKIDENFSARL